MRRYSISITSKFRYSWTGIRTTTPTTSSRWRRGCFGCCSTSGTAGSRSKHVKSIKIYFSFKKKTLKTK